jgi:chromosome segregation protein
MLADEARARSVRAEAAVSELTRRLTEYRAKLQSLQSSVHTLQIDVVKLTEIEARFNQRSTQIETDLAEITAQEEEQTQVKLESEEKFEQLDMELGNLQGTHEDGQTDFMQKEQRLADAREALRDLERAAQEVQFAEKTQRSKIEEFRRNIATATAQAAQVTESLEAGRMELESLEQGTASDGLQELLDRRTAGKSAVRRPPRTRPDRAAAAHVRGRPHVDRARLQPQRDKIMELQLKEQAARLNQEQFAAQLAEVQADEAALAEKLHPDMKASYLQGEVTRLTNAISALGAVNLAALDELATASERKNFLDAQNADLQEAIATLEDAITRSTRKRAICCKTRSTASTATSPNCSRSCSAAARPS